MVQPGTGCGVARPPHLFDGGGSVSFRSFVVAAEDITKEDFLGYFYAKTKQMFLHCEACQQHVHA